MQRKKKREFHVDRENPIQQTTEDAFSLTLEKESSISISYTLSQVFTVFSLIKINRTTIYTKNYLIRKGSIIGFFISLEKDADVIIGGVFCKDLEFSTA